MRGRREEGGKNGVGNLEGDEFGQGEIEERGDESKDEAYETRV